jgi:hypothetical protein
MTYFSWCVGVIDCCLFGNGCMLNWLADHNGAISMEAFSMGFLRGLLFAELNGEGDERVRENDIDHCFTHLDFKGVHEEFEELYKSMLLHGENDVCLKSFKKHTNVFRKDKKKKAKTVGNTKTVANTKIAPSSGDRDLAEWR